MDIVAKHMPADADGVRVAELNEMSYRRLLWDHRPLTDFWRVGRGYAKKLEHAGLMTMGDIARCSVGRASDYYNEDLLYRMFGVNAELLIDHAWGWEPCEIEDIQSYEPDAHSISSGQVLTGPADYATARLITKEMADTLALDLVDKSVLTNRLTLAVGYDIGSLDSSKLDSCADYAMKRAAERAAKSYQGPVTIDRFGRKVPKSAVGSIGLGDFTSSSARIREAMTMLYERIVDSRLLVRRLTVIADDVATPEELADGKRYEQLDLFGDDEAQSYGSDSTSEKDGEHDIQRALLDVKRKFGRRTATVRSEAIAHDPARDPCIRRHHQPATPSVAQASAHVPPPAGCPIHAVRGSDRLRPSHRADSKKRRNRHRSGRGPRRYRFRRLTIAPVGGSLRFVNPRDAQSGGSQ